MANQPTGIKYLILTIIGIFIAVRVLIFIGHEIGLLGLIVLQRYLDGKLTEEEFHEATTKYRK